MLKRISYLARAISQFLEWCESRKLELHTLEPIIIAAYIEELGQRRSPTTVKQNLAAIRMLMDYLVVGKESLWKSFERRLAARVGGRRHSRHRGA